MLKRSRGAGLSSHLLPSPPRIRPRAQTNSNLVHWHRKLCKLVPFSTHTSYLPLSCKLGGTVQSAWRYSDRVPIRPVSPSSRNSQLFPEIPVLRGSGLTCRASHPKHTPAGGNFWVFRGQLTKGNILKRRERRYTDWRERGPESPRMARTRVSDRCRRLRLLVVDVPDPGRENS